MPDLLGTQPAIHRQVKVATEVTIGAFSCRNGGKPYVTDLQVESTDGGLVTSRSTFKVRTRKSETTSRYYSGASSTGDSASCFTKGSSDVGSMDEDILKRWVVLMTTNESTLDHGLAGIDSEISSELVH